MPIQEPKGLPGLKGWSDLSAEERDAFRAAHPKMSGMSLRQQRSAYRNQQFIDRFGKDAFNQYNRQQRDQIYRAAVIGDEVDNVFKDDENYQTIKNMTPDSQYELLNSDYLEQKDRAAEAKDKKGLIRTIGLVPGTIYSLGKQKIAEAKSKDIFNEIQSKDFQRKADSVSQDSRGIAGNIIAQINSGELTADDFKKSFDEAANNTSYYRAFKDAHELQYYGLEDKIRDYAEFTALRDTYGMDTAVARMNNKIQQRVVDNQTAWDWWGSAARGVAGKTVASFGQLATGVQALYNAVKIRAQQGDDAAKEWLGKFLEGKDENGNDRPWYDNLKYWNGVDQFGAFDPTKVNEIYSSGNISEYNWQAEAGREMNLTSALNEGLKMLGYITAQILTARGVGVVGKGAAKLAGGAFSEVTGLYNAALSSGSANAIMKYITPGVVSAINAVPISVGYAKGSYDEVLQQGTDRAEKEAGNYVTSNFEKLNTAINEGIELGRQGFVAREGSGLEGVANELNNWVVSEYNNRVQQGENPNSIDVKGLYDEALASYKESQINQYYDEFKNSETYNKMIEAARKEAASAYERNATIEFIRMCGVNYLFKQYQQDKSVRAAMNSNYPNLQAVNRAGKITATGKMLGSEVSPEAARFAQPLKTLWGGFESNYMDDITAAYAKGFSLGRYNDYVDQLLDPDKTAATISWAAGFTNALAQAEGALLDKQSWYDGFIGALGSGEMIAPSRGLFRGLRGESWQRNNYSETQLANMASKYGLSIEQYINGEFEDYVKRRNPNATEAQVAEEVNRIRREDGFEKAVQDGRIERLSVGEWINNRIYNPLISQYAESAEREREFREIIDGGNKAISEKKQAIEDMLRVVYASNRKVTADKSGDIFDGEEVKAQRAFELVSLLSDWMNDPVLSQSEFVQQSWSKIQQQAKGNITEEDIQDFYTAAENQSEKERSDAAEFATQRLKSNAEQLVKMKEYYDNAMKKTKESDNYRVIAQHNAANYVTRQLAFNEAMLANRKERKAQLEQETGLSANENSHIAVAEYASRKGAEGALAAINEEIETKKKEIEAITTLLEGKEKGPLALRRLNRKSNELFLSELRRQLNELENDKARVNEDLTNDAFDRVLSADEILSLSSKERARMLNKDYKHLYSKAQQAEIDKAVKTLELRDMNALTKVRDIARLQEYIEDTETSQYIMQNNMEAAADYYEYMGELRAERTRASLLNQHFKEVEKAILDSKTDEERIAYAKALTSEQLSKYINEHPEHKDLLNGVVDVMKVSEDVKASIREISREKGIEIASRVREDGQEDTESDTAAKAEEQANLKATLTNMWDNIWKEVVADPSVTDSQSMMGVLEDLADRQEDSRVKDLYNSLLTKLESKKHARNSTVVNTRKAREAEQKRREQNAANANGKNFGWDGYVVGDTVYHNTGKEGVVAGFLPAKEGAPNGTIKVAWNGQKGVFLYTDKSVISKTKPEVKEVKPTEVQVEPTKQQEPEVIAGEEVGDWTEDGGYLAPSEEETLEVASNESDVEPIAAQEDSALDAANSKQRTKQYRAIPGLLEGNGLYRYNADLLSSLGIVEKRTGKEANDALSNFFKWLENEHIELQEIIDREIFEISKVKDAKIQFLYGRDPLLGNHLVQVVEYTDAIKKIHEPNKDLGGVIVAGEGESAKEYLVVGTTYSHIGANAFYRIANPVKTAGEEYLKSHPDAKYYVHPNIHSSIAKIDAGRLIKRQLGEDSVKIRRLSELFNDPSRNPNKISFENAVFGILYRTGTTGQFFIPNRTPSAPMFPPGKSDSTIGRIFLMFPAANGNYIPLELKTDITLSELSQGTFTNQIRDVLSRVMSPDLERRRAAVKELNRYIVMTSADKKVVNGFLVGDENHNNVTLVRDGIPVKSWQAGENIEDFINEVMTSQFEVNITQRAIKSPSTLKALDEAGVLRTDISTLRTANVAYNIFEVGADGNPIHVDVKLPEAQTQKENKSWIDKSTKIGKSTYRLINGEYYDEFNNAVTDSALRISIRYNLLIQQRGLKSAYKSEGGFDAYIINDSRENPTVISRDKDGNIKVLPKDRALNVLNFVQEQADRLERAKAAGEELRRIEEGKQGIKGEEVASWDESVETPQPAPAKPAKPTYIEPKHNDNVVYGPAIKETKIHNKWERKTFDAELHVKTTTDTNGTKLTKVVGWGTDGLEIGLPANSQESAALSVPDGYSIPKNDVGSKEVVGVMELEERADGTVRANIFYKDGLGFSYGWSTLERENTQEQRIEQAPQPQKAEPTKAPAKPKSDYNPNKATTKSLKELQEDKKVTTFGQLHSKRRKELNDIAKEKGWNWGKNAAEKEAFLKEKLGDSFHPEAINDVDAFLENLRNCKK